MKDCWWLDCSSSLVPDLFLNLLPNLLQVCLSAVVTPHLVWCCLCVSLAGTLAGLPYNWGVLQKEEKHVWKLHTFEIYSAS